MKKLLLIAAVLCAAFQLHAQDDPRIAKVDKRVTIHVTSYLMTHSVIGVPNSARASSVSVIVDDTQAANGWTGRYYVTGEATAITASRHTPNYTCHFEVTAEINDRGVVKIIDTKVEKIPSE